MENPFEIINQKLDRLTRILEDVSAHLHEPKKTSGKHVLNIIEAADLLGLAKQTLYGYTSRRIIPHYKTGKKIHFLLDELLEWVKTAKVKTVIEIQSEAAFYKPRRK